MISGDVSPVIKGCFDSLLGFKSISCLYNVRAGRESEFKIRKAKKKKKVMVIGGGPGGMEAARVAASERT